MNLNSINNIIRIRFINDDDNDDDNDKNNDKDDYDKL